jgi:hypothetical protein
VDLSGILDAISAPIDAIATSGRWQLAVVIFTYMTIVYLTNRILITSPPRLQLLERIAEERAELRSFNAENQSTLGPDAKFDAEECTGTAPEVVKGICGLLREAEKRITFQIGILGNRQTRKKRNHPFATLAKVLAGWRYVHAAERLRIKQSKGAVQRAFALIACERLRNLHRDETEFLAAQISDTMSKLLDQDANQEAPRRRVVRAGSPTTGSMVEARSEARPRETINQTAAADEPPTDKLASVASSEGLGQRPGENWPGNQSQNQPAAGDRQSNPPEDLGILLGEGLRLSYEYADVELEKSAEAQRRAMWLTTVGLIVAFILGLYGMRETLLLGAVGGFLAPLTLIWQREDKGKGEEYATSWGLLLLGPVAGALAAYGGLLLLRFLSDDKINVLGEVFRNNSWDNPKTTLALAFALLFGFSGRLFGRLALSALPQVLPPTSSGGPAGAAATPGRSS